MVYINTVIVVIQNDQDAYPELDLDDVMKIDESSREEKLAVHNIYYTHTHNVHTLLYYTLYMYSRNVWWEEVWQIKINISDIPTKNLVGMFGGKVWH